ncbi:TPA: class 1b ribonucleoside-diphosphate reductase subunit alpha [Streptococcus equi subsp. zooepidemicus]|uniref:class 1b ribonucleoside-diphosphate reductase subunit alpha n=1 Tax=Streptococcus equi TaxID=1336 RepID=UPI0013DAA58F|nr:class 1b ribonucleoside-diphosphate reductase subunit alpha [Streptococcus equi]MDI5989302.1 class 1b ribonucleoside-diphosphate reductase subunit alpha [Streptococcus equi subsp. zooepidemicus]HEL0559209.1 class 1b ribonucleoside-diphosphate reductase subunit alpha [Streptococcus equi subsp. zooepidemicus]HEL0585654.1 class 1b ribonucleoside-diphosphate reductase subunit alpha [Streptococcus equi subsp. zooepidemicus]HEL0608756.1 class 1b ribonucleoside-diphosphate reductase subunit alpha [
MSQKESYLSLNALTRFKRADGTYHFDSDKEAVQRYLEEHVYPQSLSFDSLEEKWRYLVAHDYYDQEILKAYSAEFITEAFTYAYQQKFSFLSLMGAMKFYQSYALKSLDGSQYLEHFEDRAVMNALFLANGDPDLVRDLIDQILSRRFQPATPTFLNAGKKRRGEYISCYLLRIEDNMESISRAIGTSLQLSKRGGGVALCLTNLREVGSPIKGIENQATGIVPVMKLLEDSFSYANQLGQRQGAGAVYLNVHHPEILTFLDTKRENADEKIRIKSLALGVVIPDITFQLARENKDMALFSPYDIKRAYGKDMSDIAITEEYDRLVANPAIKKTYISARKLFQLIAELHFESGYPYLLFDDTVNKRNPHPQKGRIVMSNLCSEIAQVSTASTFEEDLTFKQIGEDICCNLGSINIAEAMKHAAGFEQLIATSIRALDHVSRASDVSCAPSVEKGNAANHAVGLGAMNLHGFLATNHIFYDSAEAVDFTDLFFHTMAYYAFKASSQLAKEKGAFAGFEQSTYADGSYFARYLTKEAKPKTAKVAALLERYGLRVPSVADWQELVATIQETGLANAHLMAVAPTGSISYLSSCTPSLQPVVAPVEVRKEGHLGRVYVPAYQISDDNYAYYERGAYEVGPEPIINIVAAAQKHVDQAISLTLFMTDQATTRDLNRAYIHAFKLKCASIYYVRVRQDVLEGSEQYEEDTIVPLTDTDVSGEECQSCML